MKDSAQVAELTGQRATGQRARGIEVLVCRTVRCEWPDFPQEVRDRLEKPCCIWRPSNTPHWEEERLCMFAAQHVADGTVPFHPDILRKSCTLCKGSDDVPASVVRKRLCSLASLETNNQSSKQTTNSWHFG